MTTARRRDAPRDMTRHAMLAHIDQAAADVYTVRRGNQLTDHEIGALLVARSNITAAGLLRQCADSGLDPDEMRDWADDIQHAGTVAAQLEFEAGG